MRPTSIPAVRIVRLTALPLLLSGLTSLALATSSADRPGKTPAQTGQLPNRVVFIDAPSAETPAAREKRLRRECKGRPNAGACLGYTR